MSSKSPLEAVATGSQKTNVSTAASGLKRFTAGYYPGHLRGGTVREAFTNMSETMGCV